MKTVSVAMATYNGAQYLAGQLESLARQSKPPAELVVTDDGSTDATLDVLDAFSRTAPFPVRIHPNPHRLGYRANFMRAAQLCESAIIAFCDQDDVWHEDKLALCVDRLVSSDALLLHHNAIVTDSQLVQIDTLGKDALPQPYNPALSVSPMHYGLGFTLLFDRQLLRFSPLWSRSVDFNDGVSPEGHDQWFCFLANALGAILYVDTPFARYRRHGAAATQTGWAGASAAARTLPFLFDSLPRWQYHACGFTRRAEILEVISTDTDEPHAAAARRAARQYRQHALLYAERISLYRAPGLVGRIRLFSEILASGGYRNADVWAKGTRSAFKDLLVGVLGLNHVVHRLPAAAITRLRGY